MRAASGWNLIVRQCPSSKPFFHQGYDIPLILACRLGRISYLTQKFRQHGFLLKSPQHRPTAGSEVQSMCATPNSSEGGRGNHISSPYQEPFISNELMMPHHQPFYSFVNRNCEEDKESRFFTDPHARQHHRHHPFSRMHTTSIMQTHHPHALTCYDMNAGSFNMMQSAANNHPDRNDFIMQNLEHQQVNCGRNHAFRPSSSSTNGEFGQFHSNTPPHYQHSSNSMYPPVDFLDMSYPQSQQQMMIRWKHPQCLPIADKNISRDIPSPLPLAAGLPFPNFSGKQLLQATSNPTRSSKSAEEDTGWDELYKALEHFHRQNGHAAPSVRYKGNPKLGRWVMTQRRQYTLLMQGEHSAMTLERIEKLECLGFQWSVRPEPEIVWNKKFQQLKGE